MEATAQHSDTAAAIAAQVPQQRDKADKKKEKKQRKKDKSKSSSSQSRKASRNKQDGPEESGELPSDRDQSEQDVRQSQEHAQAPAKRAAERKSKKERKRPKSSGQSRGDGMMGTDSDDSRTPPEPNSRNAPQLLNSSETRDRLQRESKDNDAALPRFCLKKYDEGTVQGHINFLTSEPYSDRYFDILETRKSLPVFAKRRKILKLVANHSVTVIVGETGSGKTTQIPQFLVEAGYCSVPGAKPYMIGCTQPRRVAAMSVSKRVAEEMDVAWGKQVGYSVRFEKKAGSETVLKYCTDGMLLREAMTDPLLSAYSCILIDEAHERTLSTDILLGLLKGLTVSRPHDFKLIVMSATLDAQKFQGYFDNAPLLQVSGRMFPVEMMYLQQPATDYFEETIRTAVTICTNEPPGDVLLFLTGEDEIEDAVARIESELEGTEDMCGPVTVYPLYASLPQYEQQRVFDPAPGPSKPGGRPGRKVICATNIAESSLTIDGIVYVIDPGFSKQKLYEPRARSESLQVAPISRASANQRAGRAGRTRPGKCFRLYTELAFNTVLEETTFPEILRSNLSMVVMHMLKLGIRDLVHFDFLDPPAPETLLRALEELVNLGAINEEGELTRTGHMMSEFPVEPEMAKMLVASSELGCVHESLSVAAMLSTSGNVFLRPKKAAKAADSAKRKFTHSSGDHLTLLNVFHAYKQTGKENGKEKDRATWCWENYLNHRTLKSADMVRGQLSGIMQKCGLLDVDRTPPTSQSTSSHFRRVLASIACGYFMRVAFRQGGNKDASYLTVMDHQLVGTHPSCTLTHRPDWVLYQEFVRTDKRFIRTCSAIEPDVLLDASPEYYNLDLFPEGSIKNELQRVARRRKK
ncbi:putative pre-mRNA-splicing factor ATP-dependent RNA helicase DEAH2 [Porphyridium purpureum]|uniref:RNA helicase n=1 Tax=Porphyridium purpureum TaxID=35688 RepID=A0A5J4YMT4_PORPP|nr:putative pre-mRNA-splicing factor ATP-dependent RNA helicase DEAH2 [Porphyridium purpureum]|eukprot:POR6272..scf249_10